MFPNLTQLVQIVAGQTGAPQTRAAARLMSWLQDDPARLPEVLSASGKLPFELQERCSPDLILGITGAPGSGKSTLTNALVSQYRQRHPDQRVGVIAVDPSSPFTGGAVLGDRVRMMHHSTDPMVFVRSLATRGHLGGLTLGVRGILHIMSLLGCRLIIIETVGVGQSEVEIASVADLTAIVFAPGQGDSIQMLKAGLMEIGDLFVVNKADRPGADELHSQLINVLKLNMLDDSCGPHHQLSVPVEHADQKPAPSPEIGLMRTVGVQRPSPQVFLVSCVEQTGLQELAAGLDELAGRHGQDWRDRRKQAMINEVRQAILEEIRRRVESTLGANGTAHGRISAVLEGRLSVAQMAQELLRQSLETQ